MWPFSELLLRFTSFTFYSMSDSLSSDVWSLTLQKNRFYQPQSKPPLQTHDTKKKCLSAIASEIFAVYKFMHVFDQFVYLPTDYLFIHFNVRIFWAFFRHLYRLFVLPICVILSVRDKMRMRYKHIKCTYHYDALNSVNT